jgi:hypothetical protein
MTRRALLVLAATALTTAPALAAPPSHIPLTGALTNQSGGPAPDGAYAAVFTLYECANDKNAVWKEGPAELNVKGGVFGYSLGSADAKNPLKPEMFAKELLCLGVKVGIDPELPKVALGTVAHAFVAAWAMEADHAKSASALDKPLDGSQIAAATLDSAAVKFSYAGSISKGGPAVDVQCSGCVGEGDIGQGAIVDDHVAFKYAASDKKGGNALKASDLACTGCVKTDHVADASITLAKLAKDVSDGFLSTKGGALSADLDLGGHQLLNARMHNATADKFKCDGTNAGRLFFDTATKRLTFCDGQAAWKLAVCNPGVGCANPEVVECGKPMVDVCGDATCGGSKGLKCDKDQACVGDKCVDAPGSCKEWLAKNNSAQNGTYLIDPDGAGGVAPFKTYCDMGGGGFTLVMNVFDTLEDDMPNSLDLPYAGWQQVKAGVWNKGVTEIYRQVGSGVSAAVAPSLVRTMWLKGASVLRACFVSEDGGSESCRQSDLIGKSITITPAPETTGNVELAKYRKSTCSDGPACDAAYTYGRLAGIPGSTSSYDPSALGQQSFCIQRTPGVSQEWGGDGSGHCEHNAQNGHWGVWHGWGCGVSYRPQQTSDDEIGFSPGSGCGGANPSTWWGWRIYVK